MGKRLHMVGYTITWKLPTNFHWPSNQCWCNHVFQERYLFATSIWHNMLECFPNLEKGLLFSKVKPKESYTSYNFHNKRLWEPIQLGIGRKSDYLGTCFGSWSASENPIIFAIFLMVISNVAWFSLFQSKNQQGRVGYKSLTLVLRNSKN